jgi:hypothetical protein
MLIFSHINHSLNKKQGLFLASILILFILENINSKKFLDYLNLNFDKMPVTVKRLSDQQQV